MINLILKNFIAVFIVFFSFVVIVRQRKVFYF
ncbi:MAG: hypothetical protein RLZ09_2344, partial [Pseudomonadota bacterium]